MNENTRNNERPSSTADDMLADLGVSGPEADQLRAVLGEVGGLASEVPEPSAAVRAMLSGAVPLPRRRHAAVVAAAVGAMAFGGVSAAAAANRLPDRIQEAVADVTEPLPVKAPHPVKPVDPPYDAPGHIKNKPKATKTPKPEGTPKPMNTSAPGQIQKLTKPAPTDPGPARPADPGSHGRAQADGLTTGPDEAKPDKAMTDRPAPDNDDAGDNDDAVGSGNVGSTKGKSK